MLGIDTATADAAVAVARGAELLDERRAEPGPDGRPRHAAVLLDEVEAAVARAGDWGGIGLIAVGVGPGTFTGLRIGIATARALAQARGLGMAPVGSLAALAAGVGRDRAPGRPRLVAIDARRGELFAALFDPAGNELRAPFVAAPQEVATSLADAISGALAVGDGSLRFRDELEAAGAEVPAAADPVHRMRASSVCALAAGVEPVEPEQVDPIYLRRPDAEVWRDRRDRDSTAYRTGSGD